MKSIVMKFWFKNYYTVAQIRNVTSTKGGSKWFTYEEFQYMMGITVEYYDANVDLFKDMKYQDIAKWVENNPDWDKETIE